MTQDPSRVSTQEITELLKILSGQAEAIINPDKLGAVYKDIDIYGLAALLVRLRKLIEEHSIHVVAALAEMHTRIDKLEVDA